jgi:hypothetical protein
MKCIDCKKHSLMVLAISGNILKSELLCWNNQGKDGRAVVTGVTKDVMEATEAPEWCPLNVTNKGGET